MSGKLSSDAAALPPAPGPPIFALAYAFEASTSRMFLAFDPATRAASRMSAWRRDARRLLMHMVKSVAAKIAMAIAKMMVTTRPEVVRLSWRTMHVVSPADWV